VISRSLNQCETVGVMLDKLDDDYERAFQITYLVTSHEAVRMWNRVSWGRPELASGDPPFRRIVRNGGRSHCERDRC
jgi:hypothetical protein